MREITEFVAWMTGDMVTPPALAIAQAITGFDLGRPLGEHEPKDFYEVVSCVAFVEMFGLRDELAAIAQTMAWWRLVARWDRIVGLCDAVEPNWRTGKYLRPTNEITDAVEALSAKPGQPGVILMDMDCPLAGYDETLWPIVQQREWQMDIETFDQITHRLFTDHFVNDDEREACRALLREPGWFRGLDVVPGSQEGIETLLGLGHEIFVVSKPQEDNPTCEPEKKAWLREHFPAIADNYVFTPHKHVVTGSVLVDDAINHGHITTATWSPVSFAAPYNGPGTPWGRYPTWAWGDPVERLNW